jgi:hypothetical protein
MASHLNLQRSSTDNLNIVATRPNTRLPVRHSYCSRYVSSHLIESVQLEVHDLCPIVSSLSDVAKAAQRAVRSFRLCASVGVEFVKPIHYSFILQAEAKLSENRASCAEFLRGCMRYGTAVVMTCTAFASYSPFSRTRNSQDLVDRATRLATERVEVSAQPAIQMRGALLQLGKPFLPTMCRVRYAEIEHHAQGVRVIVA